MGIKSVVNADRLYWLGRYSERVYTILKLFARSFDQLIEQVGGDHAAFCASLDIPNIYTD
ncbi:MAG: alpha-E domain-containing protein [Clostridiales bacterium]|nr:alpha-E domain-containing protein [Clostridiales bacterium]